MTETPLDVWERVIAVNQTGPFLGMNAVAPTMIRQGSGSIVNISSVGGLGGSIAVLRLRRDEVGAAGHDAGRGAGARAARHPRQRGAPRHRSRAA